jgi:hypothetical protein
MVLGLGGAWARWLNSVVLGLGGACNRYCLNLVVLVLAWSSVEDLFPHARHGESCRISLFPHPLTCFSVVRCNGVVDDDIGGSRSWSPSARNPPNRNQCRLRCRLLVPPRVLSVADGYQVTVSFRAWIKLTLENKVTRDIPVLIMPGDTPYSILLGTWGLFVFRAGAAFHPLPAQWTIQDTPQGERLKFTRDNEEELLREVKRAVEAARRRREMYPLESGDERPVSKGKSVHWEDVTVYLDSETSGYSSQEAYMDMTNEMVDRFLQEMESTDYETGYDSDSEEFQTARPQALQQQQGKGRRS